MFVSSISIIDLNNVNFQANINKKSITKSKKAVITTVEKENKVFFSNIKGGIIKASSALLGIGVANDICTDKDEQKQQLRKEKLERARAYEKRLKQRAVVVVKKKSNIVTEPVEHKGEKDVVFLEPSFESGMTLREIYELIKRKENVGDIYYFNTVEGAQTEPLLFQMINIKPREHENEDYQNVLNKLKDNDQVHVDVYNSKTLKPFLTELIESENMEVLQAVKDKKFVYKSSFDEAYQNVKNENVKELLKTLKVDFKGLDLAVKRKDLEYVDDFYKNIDSNFYSRDNSGMYVFKTAISVGGFDYALDLWKKYREFLPKKSAQILQKLSQEIE